MGAVPHPIESQTDLVGGHRCSSGGKHQGTDGSLCQGGNFQIVSRHNISFRLIECLMALLRETARPHRLIGFIGQDELMVPKSFRLGFSSAGYGYH